MDIITSLPILPVGLRSPCKPVMRCKYKDLTFDGDDDSDIMVCCNVPCVSHPAVPFPHEQTSTLISVYFATTVTQSCFYPVFIHVLKKASQCEHGARLLSSSISAVFTAVITLQPVADGERERESNEGDDGSQWEYELEKGKERKPQWRKWEWVNGNIRAGRRLEREREGKREKSGREDRDW